MKTSICILLNKVNIFHKKRHSKLNKIFQDISDEALKEIAYPKNFIVILDNDGDFLLQNMIVKALKKEKRKVVYNKKVLNDPTNFLLKSSSFLSFTINADTLVLSLNSESLSKINMKKVNYFVINDIKESYIFKSGDNQYILKNIIKSLSPKTKLIINIDNPLTNSIKYFHNGKTCGYGIKNNILSSKKEEIYERCPICNELLNYKSRFFLNYGSYICPNGDFDTGIKSYEVEKIDFNKKTFMINKETFSLNTPFIYDIYSLNAFYSLSRCLNVSLENIKKCIEDFSYKVEEFNYLDKCFKLIDVINGNVTDYQKKIEYLKDVKEPIIIGFSKIINGTNYNDLSWLYEIDFSSLKNLNIYVSGKAKYDIGVRLSYDSLNFKFIDSLNDLKESKYYCFMPKEYFKSFLRGKTI